METEKVSNHLEKKNAQSQGLILAIRIIMVKRYNTCKKTFCRKILPLDTTKLNSIFLPSH